MGFLALLAGIALAALAAFVGLQIWLWRRGRIGKLIGAAISIGLAAQVYLAIYPPESFYRGEFERVTGLPFPEGSRFLFKDASYPDFHGDYTSCALIEVTQQRYDDLKAHMKPSRASLGTMSSECTEKLNQLFAGRTPLIESSADDPKGEYSYWALVADRHEVILHYVSW